MTGLMFVFMTDVIRSGLKKWRFKMLSLEILFFAKKSLKIKFLLLLALMVQCKHRQDDTSHVKYGYYKVTPQHLINLPTGGVITICGAHSTEIKEAILIWGAALERRYDFKFDCTSPNIVSYAADDPFALAECKKWKEKGIDLTGRMYTESYKNPMPMVDCGSARDKRKSILHEVGHFFGLCDQYHSQIQNCDLTTSPVPGSVMQSADRLDLSADDIVGIRNLAIYKTSGMISGEETQGVGSFVLLQEGNYIRSDINSIKFWTIKTAIIKNELKAVFIVDEDKEWKFPCDANNICVADATLIKLVDSTNFIYVKENREYPFTKTLKINISP
jgi:hypothetical protein